MLGTNCFLPTYISVKIYPVFGKQPGEIIPIGIKRVNDVNHFQNSVTIFSPGWLIFVRKNYLTIIKKL